MNHASRQTLRRSAAHRIGVHCVFLLKELEGSDWFDCNYLCKIGLEKMPYGSSWLYKSYTEESLTPITITAYYNVDEAFLQTSTAAWGNLWDCRAVLRKLVSSVYLESDLNLPFGKKRKILIPTWVYSCCVRHEENRSENCCIVFPPMGVSRMGYGHCNII